MSEQSKFNSVDDIEIRYIPMDLENVCDCTYDVSAFKKGISVGSCLAGIITAVKNADADLDESLIIELLKTSIPWLEFGGSGGSVIPSVERISEDI